MAARPVLPWRAARPRRGPEPSKEQTKVIELLGESEQGWEDAARKVVEEATRTLHGVTSVYIKEFQATVESDKVKNLRVNAKVSFKLERK
jgi:flavin-binding protein dodecin